MVALARMPLTRNRLPVKDDETPSTAADIRALADQAEAEAAEAEALAAAARARGPRHPVAPPGRSHRGQKRRSGQRRSRSKRKLPQKQTPQKKKPPQKQPRKKKKPQKQPRNSAPRNPPRNPRCSPKRPQKSTQRTPFRSKNRTPQRKNWKRLRLLTSRRVTRAKKVRPRSRPPLTLRPPMTNNRRDVGAACPVACTVPNGPRSWRSWPSSSSSPRWQPVCYMVQGASRCGAAAPARGRIRRRRTPGRRDIDIVGFQ